MLYSDEFLASLPSNPIAGALMAIEIVGKSLSENEQSWIEKDHQNLSEALLLFSEMKAAGILPIENIQKINPKADLMSRCTAAVTILDGIKDFLLSQAEETRLTAIQAKFRASLGTAFTYEFSTGDLQKLQVLINDLRNTISSNENLAADHKARLLKRLESLQGELHKKISDLDKFWGLIGDAGVVLGKLGTDAKPIVDRIREIADIVWQTQSRAEELPSGTTLPQIGNDGQGNA